jgi:hypothetical protein
MILQDFNGCNFNKLKTKLNGPEFEHGADHDGI